MIVRRIQVDEEKEEDVQRDFVARCRVANVNVKQCLEDGHGDTQFVYIYIYIYIYVRVSSFVWRIRVARVESEIGKEGERRSVARKGGETAENFG